MGDNLYSSPETAPQVDEADRRLRGPALGLLTSAALGTLVMIFVLTYYGGRLGDPETADGVPQIILGCILNLMFCLLVGAGSISMLRRRPRWLALTGAWAAVVPICGPCYVLAVPFGIWALIVLYQGEIAATFD